MSTTTTWSAPRERGSAAALRLMEWITRFGGWRVSHALLYPVTLYFLLSSPAQRRHAFAFQARARGRPARWRDVWAQYFAFSAALVDRLFFLTGRTKGFEVRVTGLDALQARIEAGQGCILLGAHVGSFEAMRALAAAGCPVEVLALMHDPSAASANAFFARHARPGTPAVLQIGQADAMLRAKECLERGGLVGILADRAPAIGAHDPACRSVVADVLGAPASLPAGPHILAGVLGAPVFLAFGIRRGPRRYEIRFEPFAERLVLDRADRQGSIRRSVERYAERLSAVARAHPDNWFNFNRFWDA
ncbi:hypothetical protein ACE7GA_08270 [Roseomonas sp. CCTCC AB2023176]|uniref:LpxL/LpxP family acyltransferase n=1 Tax=Roseomonas sp. CCTCC AB2023176 TaxID=3342640 RepID=UPI0035E092E8